MRAATHNLALRAFHFLPWMSMEVSYLIFYSVSLDTGLKACEKVVAYSLEITVTCPFLFPSDFLSVTHDSPLGSLASSIHLWEIWMDLFIIFWTRVAFELNSNCWLTYWPVKPNTTPLRLLFDSNPKRLSFRSCSKVLSFGVFLLTSDQPWLLLLNTLLKILCAQPTCGQWSRTYQGSVPSNAQF